MYRVLIVDDERIEREGLRSLLLKFGYPLEIVLKENGETALEALRASRFDLLISDIVMPQMDGLTLCHEALALQPHLVTMISSAYGDFKYTQAAIRIGVDDYLLKPVVIDSFRETIDRVLSLIQQRAQEGDTPSDNAMDVNSDPLIRDVQSLIQQHYREAIGLEWVAQQMYLSPGYLSGVFKRRTNQTITQYITLCRMRRACHLLTQTNIRVAQIGQEVGYPNSSYFGFLFRRIFGVTPNQLREGVSPDVMEKVRSILE